jgi:hypothetical protein
MNWLGTAVRPLQAVLVVKLAVRVSVSRWVRVESNGSAAAPASLRWKAHPFALRGIGVRAIAGSRTYSEDASLRRRDSGSVYAAQRRDSARCIIGSRGGGTRSSGKLTRCVICPLLHFRAGGIVDENVFVVRSFIA